MNFTQNKKEMKKYELTDETKVFKGVELHRIKALESFGNVKKGELGGWIESEKNLSQSGDAWVYDNAMVFDNARVDDNATVRDSATVFDNSEVYGDATVCENATVYGDAEVGGKAEVGGDAWVGGDATVSDNAWVDDNATVSGNATVRGNAWVSGNARVCENADFIVFKNWWSSGRYFTWTRSNDMWRVGCFFGTGEELVAKAYEDSEESGREYERVVKYVESILKEENDNGNRNKREG